MAAEDAADDPVLAVCKNQLSCFRIKELKDVLLLLGLPRNGNKRELVAKVTALLLDHQDQVSKLNGEPKTTMVGRETVVKIVDDTFRKMQGPKNTVVSSKSHIESGNSVKPQRKSGHSTQLDGKVRCPCGTSMRDASTIKCDDPQCNVWQHVGCVIIPEKSSERISSELPSSFYCEMCRIRKADPFWTTVNYPLPPFLIPPSDIATDGSYTVQRTVKHFTLTRAMREMLLKEEYDLQVWCILLNDKVPFRMHWPLHSDMEVNGIHVKVVNRQRTQQLGANGRDDGPLLTDYQIEGPNKIALSRNDARIFCLGIRIVKRISLQQVLNFVPKEQDGEKFDDALARVCRCVGGGTETNNADSDSDLEVVADTVSVNLRCPMTASRIRIAGRFKPCAHMGCFDLEAFIEINQRSRKWQCPICLKNYSLEHIIIDPFFNRITSLIQSCGVDTSEIEIKPDGSWRVKGGAELKDLAQWHLPDGTLCMTTDTRAEPNLGIVKHEVKEEPLSEEQGSGCKLGIRKNSNGRWEIRKKGDIDLLPSSDSDHARHFENENCITLTSNIEDADTEDERCNVEPGRNGFPTSHVRDLDSSPVDEIVPPAPKEQDIIVLSDSDDDVTVLSPSDVNCGSAFDTGNPFPPKPPETSGTCGEQPDGCPNEIPFIPLNEGFGDLGLSFWECPLSPQGDANHQMCNPVAGVADNPENGMAERNDGAPRACTPSERDGGVSKPNQCEQTQTCHNDHPDNSDGNLISAKNTPQKRRASGDGITALDASTVRSTSESGLTGERWQSPPQKRRSVRARLVQTVDSGSD